MANKHRRLQRAIRGAVKKLKRGEVPDPSKPIRMSENEEAQFRAQMERRWQDVQASLKKLSTDPSRAAYKKLLRLDQEMISIEKILKKSE